MPTFHLTLPGPLEPWTKVPNYLLDELMADLKDTELRVLLVGIRQTIGWQRENGTCALSYYHLESRTGRQRDALSEAIQNLSRAGLIHMRRERVSGKSAKRLIPDGEFHPSLTKKQRKKRTGA